MGELSADYSMVWWKFAPVVGPMLSAVILSVVNGYTAAVLAVYYFDRRARTQGYDLAMLAREIEGIGAPAADPVAAGAKLMSR